MEKSRLFVGTFLDAEASVAVSSLKNMNSQLSQRWQMKARFVPLPKLHLTWLFIGDVDKKSLEKVKIDFRETLESWKLDKEESAFAINYDSIEVWPSLRSPRVLVLESTSACPQAESLNQAISLGLNKYCQKDDKDQRIQRFKRFRPHLTVCRFSPDSKSKAKRSLEDFESPADFFPLTHKVETVSLIESNLNAGPNGYSSIQDISLLQS